MRREDFDRRMGLLLNKLKPRKHDKPLLKAIRIFCGGVDPYELVCRARKGEVDLAAHFAILVNGLRGLAPKTISFYLSLVRKWLRVMGVHVDNRAIRDLVEIPRVEPSKSDRAPTREELRRILLNCSPRNRVMFQLIAVCGLRLSEALRLKVGDVIMDGGLGAPHLRVKSAKTGRIRLVPLTGEMAEILRDYIGRGRDPDEYLFHPGGRPRKQIHKDDAYKYFMEAVRKAGLLRKDSSGRGYELHPHSLRKFFKTQLESAGVNPLLIERWMGHNLGSVAQAYFRPSDEYLRKEWQKAEEALTLYLKRPNRRSEIEETIESMRRKLDLMWRMLRLPPEPEF